MQNRNIYLDNVKVVLVFLVVLGHFININRSIPIVGGISNIIYSFHMPLFIFLSGYFSKKVKSQRSIEITKVLYTYIVFELIHFLFTSVTSLGKGSFNIFRPTYQNWYILGIFFWRLFVPYFNYFKKIYSLLFLFLFSVYLGFWMDVGRFLALYKIIYFFPIFVLGYYSPDINKIRIKYLKYKYIFISIFAFLAVLIFLLSYTNNTFSDLINYAYSPTVGYNNDLIKLTSRVLGLSSCLIIFWCFLFLIPIKETFYSKYGKNTLNVYLLHMFFVWPIIDVLSANKFFLLFSLPLSILITWLLSTEFISIFNTPLTNFRKISNFNFGYKKVDKLRAKSQQSRKLL